ncbi:citrate synthase family protein [Deinococcus sonorensis]|uniref:citrate synthase (unknown stereospecificity) n=2 Tax=Deinococcus sonorensis TaxID=309891 RepID=A0AAU7U978_9DEIO
MTDHPDATLSAEEAAQRLGVSRATLYAYVSRGLVRSEPGQGRSRERRYRRSDIEGLERRREERRDPAGTAQAALDMTAEGWGTPLLSSALCRIEDGQLSYRGQPIERLVASVTVEQMAGLLWTGQPEAWTQPALRARLAPLPLLHGGTLLEAFAHALASAAAREPTALDQRVQTLPQRAARTLHLLYAVTERLAGRPPAPDLPLHQRLARAWDLGPHADLLRRALVVVAEHELNVSAFTARTVASSGASLPHVTLAALCAFQGPRHGLATLQARALLTGTLDLGAQPALTRHLQLSGHPAGFGHRLYPAGDPRARLLLEALPEGAVQRSARALEATAYAELNERPNLDLGLAALGLALNLSEDQTLALFVLGRTVGWLAHALETVQSGQFIRPRARYVGP